MLLLGSPRGELDLQRLDLFPRGTVHLDETVLLAEPRIDALQLLQPVRHHFFVHTQMTPLDSLYDSISVR